MEIGIMAEVSVSGTAIAETALCGRCETVGNVERFYALSYPSDPASGRREDCSGNDSLSCQACGYEVAA